jgi:hypothetical protein
MSSFKLYNANLAEAGKINDVSNQMRDITEGLNYISLAVTELQNGGTGNGVRPIFTLQNVGGASINSEPNGTVAYSISQDPGVIAIDNNITSPPIGTEYIIYTADNNSVILQNQKDGGRIQISGTAPNTSNLHVIMLVNCKCTVTKLTNTLWIAQGDSLSYFD